MSQEYMSMAAQQIRKVFNTPEYENLETLADEMLKQEELRIRTEDRARETDTSITAQQTVNVGDTPVYENIGTLADVMNQVERRIRTEVSSNNKFTDGVASEHVPQPVEKKEEKNDEHRDGADYDHAFDQITIVEKEAPDVTQERTDGDEGCDEELSEDGDDEDTDGVEEEEETGARKR